MRVRKRKAGDAYPNASTSKKSRASPLYTTLSGLESLSAEIIQSVLEYLPQASLKHVALTSRHLHAYANHTLYRHIKISATGKGVARSLLRTFLRRVKLATVVRTIEIPAGKCTDKECSKVGCEAPSTTRKSLTERERTKFAKCFKTKYGDWDAESSFQSIGRCELKLSALLLHICPNLRKVSIDCYDTSWTHGFAPFLDTSTLTIYGLEIVSHLTLRQDRMAFADRTSLADPSLWPTLVALVRLPSLQSLSISHVEAVHPPNLPFEHLRPMSSKFTSLELRDCVFLPAALRTFLTFCPALEKLRIEIPHHYANQYAEKVAFAPWDGLTEALEPVKSTLEELEFDARNVWWHYQAVHAAGLPVYPIASLKGFGHLSFLRLPVRAVLCQDKKCEGVEGLMPPKIKVPCIVKGEIVGVEQEKDLPVCSVEERLL